ncbi:O-antigen ligase family protein [bacterium]|nr:O-antigen ligase family protein [bacterium]
MQFISQEFFLVLLLVFIPLAHGSVEVWATTILQTTAFSLVFWHFCLMIKNGRLKIFRTALDWLVLVFLILILVSTFFSVYSYASRVFALKILSYFAIFYLVLNQIRTEKKLGLFLQTLAFSGSFYAIAGLVLIDGEFFGFQIFSRNPSYVSLTFVNHNHFAGYLEMIVWLCLSLAIVNSKTKRTVFFLLAVYVATAIFLSQSRGGMISFCVSVVFFTGLFLFSENYKKVLPLLLFFSFTTVLVIFVIGFEPIFERLETLKNPFLAGEGRLMFWKSTTKMILDNFWFGTGIGTYIFALPRYQTDFYPRTVSHAHNDYFEVFAELGFVGFAVVVCSLAFFFVVSLKKLFAQKNPRLQVIGFAGLTACFSLLVHAFTEFNFHIPANAVLFLVCVAIVLLVSGERKTFELSINYKILGYTFVSVCFLVALFFSTSAFVGSIFANKGEELIKAKKYELAFFEFEKAARIDFGNAEHVASLGKTRLLQANSNKKLLREALVFYERATQILPLKSYFYTKRAFVFKELGEVENEEKELLKAVLISPKVAFVRYDLANFYLRQNQREKAFEEYKVLTSFGNRYLVSVLGDLSKAGFSYAELDKIVPENLEARKFFVSFLLKNKKQKEAIRELGGVFLLDFTVESAIYHLDGLFVLGEFGLALEENEKYLAKFPDSKEIQKNKAKVLERVGRNEEAVEVYKKLIKQNPFEAKLYVGISRNYEKTGMLDETEKILQEGIKQIPNDGELYFTAGVFYKKIGNFEEAFKNLKKAVFVEPENPEFHYQLGQVYKNKGLYQQAMEEFEICLKLFPKHEHCKSAKNELLKNLKIN